MSGCSIKLEHGKKYNGRGGGVYGPIIDTKNGSQYPFEYKSGVSRNWQENGWYFDHPGSYLDLISEYVEPAAQDTTPADEPRAGRKDDTGKLPLGLIPREALLAEAAVLAFGAQKYDAHNWRKGMRWSRLGDAAMRHLLAWLDGEDLDPETGLSHLAHLRCCAGFLLNYAEHGVGEDDRHPRVVDPRSVQHHTV
jgi:hypothetical protein